MTLPAQLDAGGPSLTTYLVIAGVVVTVATLLITYLTWPGVGSFSFIGGFAALAFATTTLGVSLIVFDHAEREFVGRTVADYVQDTYDLVALREATVGVTRGASGIIASEYDMVTFDAIDADGHPVVVTVTWTSADTFDGSSVPDGYDPVVVKIDDGAHVTVHNGGKIARAAGR